jgi:tetratricopeptide (TPR) repeat protein
LRKFPKWAVPIAFFVIGGGVIMLSNRPVQDPEGNLVITSVDQFNQITRDLNKLVADSFAADEAGQELTDEQRAKLREAVLLYDAQNAFRPSVVGPFLGAARCYTLLGDDASAEIHVQQLISNQNLYDSSDLGKRAAVDAKWLLSRIRFRQNKYEEAYALADECLLSKPGFPPFLLAKANPALQLGKVEEAQALASQALLIDANNKRAAQLVEFIQKSQIDKKK